MAGFSDVDVNKGGGSAGGLNITVCDPVKQNDGINAFISYKVSTQTDRSDFKAGRFDVVRRYSDFVWLVHKLTNTFPGCIVPPLPEKLLVGRFSHEFVEARRRSLEKFLNRVAHHPELTNSKHFALFLTADEAGLHAAKEESKPKPSMPQPKKMMEMFSNAVSTVQHSFHPNSDLIKDPNDGLFEEISAYVNQLETQFLNVQKHTSNLIRKGRDSANSFFEFGLSMTLLGQSERGGLGESLKELGKVSDSLSVLSNAEAEKEGLQFEDPLTEYCRIIASVKVALSKRQEARVAYGHALVELDTKNTAHAKLVGLPGKEERANVAEAAVVKAQTAVDDAKKEFDTISERFLREFDRFKREKGQEVKQIMLDFVALQVEYHKAVEKAWVELIPRLQSMDVSEATGGGTGQSGPSTESKASSSKLPSSSLHQANSHSSSSASSSYNNDRDMAESTLVGV